MKKKRMSASSNEATGSMQVRQAIDALRAEGAKGARSRAVPLDAREATMRKTGLSRAELFVGGETRLRVRAQYLRGAFTPDPLATAAPRRG